MSQQFCSITEYTQTNTSPRKHIPQRTSGLHCQQQNLQGQTQKHQKPSQRKVKLTLASLPAHETNLAHPNVY